MAASTGGSLTSAWPTRSHSRAVPTLTPRRSAAQCAHVRAPVSAQHPSRSNAANATTSRCRLVCNSRPASMIAASISAADHPVVTGGGDDASTDA